MDKSNYQYINLRYIYEIVDNDEDFLSEIIEGYIETISPQLHKLQEAIKNENTGDALFLSHKLKGSLRFIGCNELGDTIEQIETQATQSQLQQSAGLMENVIHNYAKTEDELRALLASIRK